MTHSKLRQIHIIFRHGEKTPDNFLMFSTDPYKNETFYPYGPSALTNMFCAILMEDYIKLYNEYCFNGNGKAAYKEAKPVLDYAEKHTNTTYNTFLQLFFLHAVLSAEEEYGLELPKWTNEIYPYPLNNLVIKHFSTQLATKELKKMAVGRLMKKILEDSVNIIERNSSYKVHLYSGHDVTIAHVLIFLEIMYTSQAGWGACLILEQHEENGSHFIEVA
ncbi:acid phosphatase-related [Holotrichia oblita]|uniref:Acid phosphatase-related n=1 Tax=Holotrichia oblita TaxID=644536 RepID=A0ACB9SYH6_HOLOL|nr:acid phosphatase-related [Holotrichia oblita]